MRIEVRGRNTEVTAELEDAIRKRFKRVGKQVSELATLDVELCEEKNPRIADKYVAEATLRLKGTTIRAKEASPEMLGSIHELAEDVRRQVKKNRELRRHRNEVPPLRAPPQPRGLAAQRLAHEGHVGLELLDLARGLDHRGRVRRGDHVPEVVEVDVTFADRRVAVGARSPPCRASRSRA